MANVNELNSRFTQPTDGIELVVEETGEASQITYTQQYETNDFSSSGINGEVVTASRADAEHRISDVKDRMGIFLYNLFPYETMDALGQIETIVDDPAINATLAASAFTSLSGLNKLKYFTPAELALTLGQNFYSLGFFRGISLKKGKKGAIGFPAGRDDVYTGAIDLYYGRDQNRDSLIDSARQYFSGAKDIAENGNAELAKLKEDYAPRYETGYGYLTETKKNSFVDQLDSKNFMETRNVLFTSLIKDQKILNAERWKKWNLEDDTTSVGKSRQEYRKHETDAQEYLINKSVLDIVQRVNAFVGLNWKGGDDPSSLSTEEFDYDNVKTRKHETDATEYLVNNDVLEMSQRTNQSSGGKWQGQRDSSKLTYEDFDFVDVELRTHETNQNSYLINEDVTKINQRVNTQQGSSWKFGADNSQIDEEEFNYRDVRLRTSDVKNFLTDSKIDPSVININLRSNPVDEGNSGDITRDDLREKSFTRSEETGIFQIGAVYVIPIVAAQDRNKLPPFFIPFEFNPQISENSVEARYQQTEILSRIGNMQTYTGTNSLSVSLTTNYFAVSHDPTFGNTDGSGWMSDFTLPKIQGIEFAYRSLVYPHYPEEQSVDQGYKYIKPPLVKVVIGDWKNNDTAPYSNILTYQRDSVVEGRLQSNFQADKKRLRTFIVTGVSIKKDLEATPLYLDENKAIRDTFGFEASLNLIEVTPNYIDTLPDYKNYYDQFSGIAGLEDYIDSTGQPTSGETGQRAVPSGLN